MCACTCPVHKLHVVMSVSLLIVILRGLLYRDRRGKEMVPQ